MEGGEEGRAFGPQVIEKSEGAPVEIRIGVVWRWWQQRCELVGEVERDTAVALSERGDADPHHLAGAYQQVELPGVVAVEASRQGFAREDRRRQRSALELLDHIEQRIDALPPHRQSLPGDGQTAERDRFDRLDLAPQPGEGSLANPA
jgi:hypothetical protein